MPASPVVTGSLEATAPPPAPACTLSHRPSAPAELDLRRGIPLGMLSLWACAAAAQCATPRPRPTRLPMLRPPGLCLDPGISTAPVRRADIAAAKPSEESLEDFVGTAVCGRTAIPDGVSDTVASATFAPRRMMHATPAAELGRGTGRWSVRVVPNRSDAACKWEARMQLREDMLPLLRSPGARTGCPDGAMAFPEIGRAHV